MASYLDQQKIKYIAGSEHDLIDRHLCACSNSTRAIVRITSDCPLVDPYWIDRAIELYQSGFDYVSTYTPAESSLFCNGSDIEVFSFELLKTLSSKFLDPLDREHVTFPLWDGRLKCNYSNLNHLIQESISDIRITLDYSSDLFVLRSLSQNLDLASADLSSIARMYRQLNLHLVNGDIKFDADGTKIKRVLLILGASGNLGTKIIDLYQDLFSKYDQIFCIDRFSNLQLAEINNPLICFVKCDAIQDEYLQDIVNKLSHDDFELDAINLIAQDYPVTSTGLSNSYTSPFAIDVHEYIKSLSITAASSYHLIKQVIDLKLLSSSIWLIDPYMIEYYHLPLCIVMIIVYTSRLHTHLANMRRFHCEIKQLYIWLNMGEDAIRSHLVGFN